MDINDRTKIRGRVNTTRNLTREYERIHRLLASDIEQQLLSLPSVWHVGVGLKEKADRVIDQICIRVYVAMKKPPNQLAMHERIPPYVRGIPTDVIIHLPTIAACGDSGYRSILTPGIQIGNEKTGEGTLGCFARLQGQPNSVVLISNYHVLYIGGVGANARIGQPSVSCSSCSRCGPIANNIGDGSNGWGQSYGTLNIEDTTYQVSDADCAAAQLITNVRPFTNQIPCIGMISGTPPPGQTGVVSSTSRPPHPDSIVRKFGIETELTVGQVVHLSTPTNAPVYDKDSDTGRALVKQILVMPLEGPTRGGKIDFLDEGDSGSVVVNRYNQVIGLLRGMTSFTESELAAKGLPRDRGRFGVVVPIQRVKDILHIEIPANFHSTATNSGAVIEIQETAGTHALPHTPPVSLMRKKLMEMPGGKILAELVKRHQREVDRLMGSSRPVIVAWHRSKGPAWVAHVLNSINDKSYIIPQTIEEITQKQVLTRMYEVFNAHGSEAFRADLERYGSLALDMAGINNIAEFLHQLSVLPTLPGNSISIATQNSRMDMNNILTTAVPQPLKEHHE